MDMSTLETQEFVYTWLVKIFMKSKALTFDSEISVVDSVVKPRQVDGVGAVKSSQWWLTASSVT
jgi:hypothetical protein